MGVPKRLEATKPPVGSLAVHPKGELVIHTSPADGLVWLWDPATGQPVLILIEAYDEKLHLAARNLANVDIRTVASLDPLSLARYPKVLATVGALRMLEEKLA